MSMTTIGPRTGRFLVPPELFDRLTARITSGYGFDHGMAARIMDQALVFLAACATNTGAPLSPSPLVDIGWHTFILYTGEYAEFCEHVAGRFIHHAPTDADGPGHVSPADTLAAVRATGYPVDETLWIPQGADCTNDCHQCHQGCTDSPHKKKK